MRKSPMISRRAVLAGGAAVLGSAQAVRAQSPYPTKPIKILVPYAPGGSTDVVARLVSEQMRQLLGQAVVVENKPGASGIIAIEEMARAKPDGYTLMIGNISTNALTPILLAKKFTIDYERDIQIVGVLATAPIVFTITTKDFTPKTIPEFVAAAKAQPGKLRYGSAGFGAFQQLDSEHFAKRAGIELVHIPVKAGGSQLLRDVANGDLHASWFNIANIAPLTKAGLIRPIGIALDQRHPDWPDVPTMAEQGYPGVGSGQWQAAFAPAATPKDIVETLNRAFMGAVETRAVEAAYKKGGNVPPQKNTPAEASAWLKGEMAKWKSLIAELNITMEE